MVGSTSFLKQTNVPTGEKMIHHRISFVNTFVLHFVNIFHAAENTATSRCIGRIFLYGGIFKIMLASRLENL